MRVDHTEVEQASIELQKLVHKPVSVDEEQAVEPSVSDEEKDLMRRMTCEQTQNCFQCPAEHCDFLKRLHELYAYHLFDLVEPRQNHNIQRHMTLKMEIQVEYDIICAYFFREREKQEHMFCFSQYTAPFDVKFCKRDIEMCENTAAVVLAVRRVFIDLVSSTVGPDGEAGHFFKPWYETDLAHKLVSSYDGQFTAHEETALIVRDVWQLDKLIDGFEYLEKVHKHYSDRKINSSYQSVKEKFFKRMFDNYPDPKFDWEFPDHTAELKKILERNS